MKIRNFAHLGTGAALLAAAGAASAAEGDTALSTITGLTTGAASYGAPMFALAAAAVGILIGVKWIKRARGAA